MKYAGFVSDKVYLGDGDAIDVSEANPLKLEWWSKSVDGFLIDYYQNGRVFSDEILMAAGMIAYNQMQRVFKSKHVGKWSAWQAWRELV